MVTIADTRAERIPRREFVKAFGEDYSPGQHVTFIGPTGKGKTTMCFQMLGRVISPEHRATILHGKIKGRDPVIGKAGQKLNLRTVSTWPPTGARIRDRNKNGYILLPLHKPGETPAEEEVLLREQFRKAIHTNYTKTKGQCITVVDESHQVQHELGLKKDVEGPLMRGAPNNAEWNLIQRGRYVSYHCYNAPEWVVIFKDDDESNQRRYSEIGGVDPEELIEIQGNLRTTRVKDGRTISEALVVRRAGPDLFIVGM